MKNTNQETISNEKLQETRSRIRKGKKWLDENLEHEDYKHNLKTYERLVDIVRQKGIKESDCWSDTVENMTESEIIECLT